MRDTFTTLKNKKTDPTNDMQELDEEILRSVAFMRQEKCEYEKTDIQSLLSDSETDAESVKNYENILDRTLERRRLLDILIDNINVMDFRK